MPRPPVEAARKGPRARRRCEGRQSAGCGPVCWLPASSGPTLRRPEVCGAVFGARSAPPPSCRVGPRPAQRRRRAPIGRPWPGRPEAASA
eukprot:scaffold102827_cov60-Phaeocystis_antarctica.AAC.3